jgi:hypothetical protein
VAGHCRSGRANGRTLGVAAQQQEQAGCLSAIGHDKPFRGLPDHVAQALGCLWHFRLCGRAPPSVAVLRGHGTDDHISDVAQEGAGRRFRYPVQGGGVPGGEFKAPVALVKAARNAIRDTTAEAQSALHRANDELAEVQRREDGAGPSDP